MFLGYLLLIVLGILSILCVIVCPVFHDIRDHFTFYMLSLGLFAFYIHKWNQSLNQSTYNNPTLPVLFRFKFKCLSYFCFLLLLVLFKHLYGIFCTCFVLFLLTQLLTQLCWNGKLYRALKHECLSFFLLPLKPVTRWNILEWNPQFSVRMLCIEVGHRVVWKSRSTFIVKVLSLVKKKKWPSVREQGETAF